MSKNINNQIPVLPKDWCYYRFGNVAKVLRGGSPRPIQKYITRDINGVNWIKIGDTNINDMYINKTSEKITKSGAKYSRYVNIGDIILSNSMSFGRPYILNINGCIHDGWLVIQDYSETYDTTFLYYALSSNIVKQQYIRLASGSGVKNLNKKTVSNTYIITPPKEEQVKIVNVLKNIDKLIYNLEILIKKKEYIKKGLMQELLTYKTVIKNYDNIFITTSLGQLSLINTGDKNNEDKVVNGRYPFFVRSNQIMKINTYSYDGEAILVAGDGNIGEVYHYYVGKFDYHQRVYKISNFKNCYGKFIFYFMQLFFKATAIKNTAKATVNSLRMDTFKNFVLTMPKSINEQKAIANIISNIDNEIMSLNDKLYKYRQIKQGIMEELLTGKKRL